MLAAAVTPATISIRREEKTEMTTQPVLPALGFRVGYIAGGLGIAVVGVVLICVDPQGLLIVGGLVALFGLATAWRLGRQGVLLEPETLIIRGVFGSRRIAKSAITSVERFPYIDWNDKDSVSHQSNVIAFSGGSLSGGGAEARSEAKDVILRWLHS